MKRSSTGNYSLCEISTVKAQADGSKIDDRPCLRYAVRTCWRCGAHICDEHAIIEIVPLSRVETPADLQNPNPKVTHRGTSFSCLGCYS